jgi:hydrogenase-4 component F
MLTRSPGTGAAFGIAMVALLGLPPFSLFASELGIARAGLDRGHGWLTAAAFALVLIAFAAIARHSATMLLGQPPAPPPPPEPAHDTMAVPSRSLIPLALGLATVAALGLTLGPLRPLLDAAAAIAGGHR